MLTKWEGMSYTAFENVHLFCITGVTFHRGEQLGQINPSPPSWEILLDLLGSCHVFQKACYSGTHPGLDFNSVHAVSDSSETNQL